MKRNFLRSTVLWLLVAALFGTSLAEDIYVRNKPFKGQVMGQGMSTEISVEELASALGLEAVSDNGFWKLGEMRVPGRKQDGKIFVNLKDLKKAGLMVMHSPELGTVDIAMPRASKKTAGEAKPRTKNQVANSSWGGTKPTLVYFGADW